MKPAEREELEEFEDILAAKGYGKEKIKEVLGTEREDVVDLLHSESAGAISIALMMLDAGISIEITSSFIAFIEKIKKVKKEREESEKIKKRGKRARRRKIEGQKKG